MSRKHPQKAKRVRSGRGTHRRRSDLAWTAAAGGVIALGVIWALVNLLPPRRASPADPEDEAQVARGAALYAAECSRCHGARLEGQLNWQSTAANGVYPAPPHDATGHTWHHADADLFAVVKHGGNTRDSTMPGFEDRLSDEEIWATLAFIKSHWPEQVRRRQPATPR